MTRRERWRPQFHYSPARNWMNDPNGLVSHAGEHHAFYQHNPSGIEWGNMSWGHAVSRDLVHWDELPVALPVEGVEEVYSGCVVVDHANTSGFATGDAPPMVAVYTAHRPWHESQSLAYSNDLARTWRRYEGNPVLDLGLSDFRDPKVVWHEPTKAWVMVVALATELRLQFYRSTNLRDWSLLSEFGPAGMPGKASWECPEIVELPIRSRTGEPTDRKRWMLKADAGGSAVTGGSCGEYFLGEFDGEAFRCDDPPGLSHRVDYGRDFFAATAWHRVPGGRGAPVWIGWLGNWNSVDLPTSPWRGDFSVPRALELLEGDDGLRLTQRPIAAIASLRGESALVADQAMPPGEDVLASAAVRGASLDIELTVHTGDAERVELQVLAGGTWGATVSYEPGRRVLTLDRSRAGSHEYHTEYPALREAPLTLPDGVLSMRVLIDESILEVFAEGGLVCLTDRVFPDEGCDGVTLRAIGGAARLLRFEAWRMRSIWP